IGENLPYLVTDVDTRNGNINYQAMGSLPFRGTDGQLKIMSFKSLKWPHASNYQFSFDFRRDGFDLIDVAHSGYISFIRTSDPGCYDQLWSISGNVSSIPARAGGWILFPKVSGMFSTGNSNNMTYNTPLSPTRPSQCQGGNSYGTTFWNSPAIYRFESNKVMTAIKSYHFASTNLNQTNNALELYYFTKEYGFTRWEAWIPQTRCYNEHGSNSPICHPDWSTNTLMGRCSVLNVSGTGHPAIDSWGGQTWVRVDCRDETNYIALTTPQILMDRTLAQNNGFVDLDTSGLQSLPVAAKKVIPAGTILTAGQQLTAGNVFIKMQTDGNLVIYGPSGAVWASSWYTQYNVAPFTGPTQGLACAACSAYFQEDGNLVLYNPNFTGNPYRAYWSSNTHGPGRMYILTTSSPYLKITQGAIDASSVINSYYLQYLGRNADSEGLNYYVSQYNSGRSLSSIEQEIKNSYAALLRGLYLTYFLREPDAAGFAYWLNELNAGHITIEGVRTNFRYSSSCQVQCL
ncbi:MAG: hypothetical protein AB7H97_16815, partial [Pseudobdellovibrionaceae bacterium]